MENSKNRILSDIFNEIADILEILDENQFKISAFRNSARVFDSLNIPIEEALITGELQKIKGIGKATLDKVQEFISTNNISYHNELLKTIPKGLLEILKVKGLGPKKVKTLWKELGISSLGELEYACKENRLTILKGFGEKTQSKVLEYLDFLKKESGKFLINKIFNEQIEFENFLSTIKEIKYYSPISINRRFEETYDSINYLLSGNNLKKIQYYLTEYLTEVTYKNDIIYGKSNGIPFKIYVTNDSQFYSNLFFKTGDDFFIKEITNIFENHNIKITNEQFLLQNKPIVFESEYEIFDKIGLPYIPPQLRDYPQIINYALNNKIKKPLSFHDLKGALHIHTNYSDGSNSIEEMVISALKLGFKYIGICDHSKSAFYANGLSIEKIIQQHKEIDDLQKKYNNIKILKGIESDILKDGSLDYPDNVLNKFDFIVASIHSNFNLTYDDMTTRLVNAAKNKYTSIIGHPTGRLLLSRDSYKFDWNKVLNACKENNTILEFNSDEHRLDISYKIMNTFTNFGIYYSINSDAHRTDDLNNLKYGVSLVNKTLISNNNIINTYEVDDFLKIINKKHF